MRGITSIIDYGIVEKYLRAKTGLTFLDTYGRTRHDLALEPQRGGYWNESSSRWIDTQNSAVERIK